MAGVEHEVAAAAEEAAAELREIAGDARERLFLKKFDVSDHDACQDFWHDLENVPVTALVDQFYAEVQEMGGGRWDTSSLIRRLTRAKSR